MSDLHGQRRAQVRSLLAEHLSAVSPTESGQAAAIRTAIFVEEVFDVVIPEEQLDAAHLGPENVLATVCQLLEI